MFKILRATIATFFTLGMLGVAAAQSQDPSHAPDSEFIPGGISCGQGRTVYDYRTKAGEVLFFKEWRLPSETLVKSMLARGLGPSAEEVERFPVLDEGNNEIGVRVVVRFKGGVAAYELRGKRLLIAEASSVESALRFERYLKEAGQWHSAARRPTTR